MSFYTALTGLNGSQADIAATSNNIANVGTTGFKRSRAEFGDIYATSPLQNASSAIGSGTILKGVKQQFTQGNIATSLNTLDLAITGQGFFAMKPSITSNQIVYTRNGSFGVDNQRNIVDSSGQLLLTYPVNGDGSVISKSIENATPLKLPMISGKPKVTRNVDLTVNLPADAPVILKNPKFSDGYRFDMNDPDSYTASSSITIFDELGNPTIATVYFVKTQTASSSDPTSKFQTYLAVDGSIINPDLVEMVNDAKQPVYMDRFGRETTLDNIPDDTFFADGKGSALYKKDNLNQMVPSSPARLKGMQSAFDFGADGNKVIEITNDPMRFKATREAGNDNASIFWGNDFLLVNVDDGDVPVSVDLRPGYYNATQLADEVERAINDAYGDDSRLQIRSNFDDKLTVDFSILNTNDGTLKGLAQPVEIDLLQPSYVSEQFGIDTTGASPDFTREEFLAHAQLRINDALNKAGVAQTSNLGVQNQMFARASSSRLNEIPDFTEIIPISHFQKPEEKYFLKPASEKLSIDPIKSDDASFSLTTDIPNAKVVLEPDDAVSTEAGSVSIVDGEIYLGDGSISSKIGDVPFHPKLEGNFPLSLTLSTTFNNGSFELDLSDDSVPGWTVHNEQFITGNTAIEGFVGPQDPTYPLYNTTKDTSPGISFNTSVGQEGGNNYMEMSSNGRSDSYSVVRGPYIVSDNPVYISANDEVSFNYKAKAGGDAYDILGYLINVDTGEFTELINETGTTADWTEKKVTVPSDGQYKFAFISGSFDQSGGTVLGATMYVDDIKINRQIPFDITDSVISQVVKKFAITTEAGAPLSPSGEVFLTGIAGGDQLIDRRVDVKSRDTKYLLNSFNEKYPDLSVFDDITELGSGSKIEFNSATEVLSVSLSDTVGFSVGEQIALTGDFQQYSEFLNGAKFSIMSIDHETGLIKIDTTDLSFPESSFELTWGAAPGSDFKKGYILSEPSKQIEAFFENHDNKFHASKIIVREIGSAAKNNFTNDYIVENFGRDIFSFGAGLLQPNADVDTLKRLGLDTPSVETVWVDEKNPPVRISYDAVNQRFEFGVNQTAIGPGTDSNFRAFKIFGAGDARGTNNLGIPAADGAETVPISSTGVFKAEPFVADGQEIQLDAKRYGVNVTYNRDIQSFTFSSGTTGEAVRAKGAIGVEVDQSASNIQVGRYSLDPETGAVLNGTFDTGTRSLGTGNNGLMGVGINKTEVSFTPGRGLKSEPAQVTSASAPGRLNEIFAISSVSGENLFNVSVNGINGIIEVPSGNYVGTTLATALQTRINQMSDGNTGAVVGGVTVRYQPESNNFVFTTATTGPQSTIKVKGAAKFGMDDIPLGVGSVPEIVNLIQATNPSGVPLYVNADGEIVETPPENLVEDYYPVYIDEGELTFDKTGQIISPINRVHYEHQGDGLAIDLNVDYSASTQLSQPFVVNGLYQDGFTSGRLTGLDIDSTGVLRANYTNGENKPLGKIVLANFNNQNGLKQIGNATFVATAVSGEPRFGEAGAEGFGSIRGGSLERSNVDITEELVNLITAQRNFQAASKAIETVNMTTQAILQMRSS